MASLLPDRPAALRLAALACVLLLAHTCAACTVGNSLAKHKFAVLFTGTKPAKPAKNDSYGKSAVEQHFQALELDEFRPVTASTFSCVDSRSEHNILGTPGGDFAELAAAIVVYENQANLKLSEQDVADVFNAFMNSTIISKDRPFYLHSSDGQLHKVFDAVYNAGVKPRPVVFPEKAPADAATKEIWLNALANGTNQGCGHVKLMITRYWWPTPPGSEERSKTDFEVVQGPLDGKAVVIVDAPGCKDSAPVVPASYRGSQVFIYHANAVDGFRRQVLAPWFKKYAATKGISLDEDKFYNELKSLQAKDLSAVLTHLDPANALPLWAVNYQT